MLLFSKDKPDPIVGLVIEIEDENSDVVNIFRTEDGVKVEGRVFSLPDFMDVIEEYYNRNK